MARKASLLLHPEVKQEQLLREVRPQKVRVCGAPGWYREWRSSGDLDEAKAKSWQKIGLMEESVKVSSSF